jgi:hypothetical protein
MKHEPIVDLPSGLLYDYLLVHNVYPLCSLVLDHKFFTSSLSEVGSLLFTSLRKSISIEYSGFERIPSAARPSGPSHAFRDKLKRASGASVRLPSLGHLAASGAT